MGSQFDGRKNSVAQENVLRRLRFAPYRPGHGPRFALLTWDTGRRACGKWLVGYRLSMIDGTRRTVLFEGEDFGCSPLHAIDSDQVCAAIMVFLTLRPGDTDAEYFENYTQVQLDYCAQHAEALASAVQARFPGR